MLLRFVIAAASDGLIPPSSSIQPFASSTMRPIRLQVQVAFAEEPLDAQDEDEVVGNEDKVDAFPFAGDRGAQKLSEEEDEEGQEEQAADPSEDGTVPSSEKARLRPRQAMPSPR